MDNVSRPPAVSGGADEEIGILEEIARRHLQWEGNLTRDRPLIETLALDSLRLLTLVVAVEDRFRICLDEEDEANITTVGDLVDLIRRKRG
jgi:acyl carrier protein